MSSTRKALGDFQTPLDLARGVVERLRARAPFTTVLEPTCGKGAFLQAAAEGAVGVQRLLGLEIQAVHLAEAATRLTGAPVELREGDLFTVDLAEWVGERPGELLVVGNPPWVTAAELGAMGIPRPTCSKPTGLGGLESLTGRSNFDLAEAVWLKLIEELTYARPTIALLCKQSVARRVLGWCRQCEVPMAGAQFIPINGKRWFGIAAECGLFVIDVAGEVGPYSYDVFEGLTDRVAVRTVGFRGDQLVPDLARFESVAAFGGQCPAVWRQGLKHDAADVMELEVHGAGWTDRAGRPIDLDPHTVYPLAKGGDVYHGRVLSKAVVVPQKSLGQDTTHLRETAPRTWAYLNGCRARLDRRRSRIYQGRPPFSIFGIGDYAFAPYKVAVSSMHRSFAPRLLVEVGDRPVMLDDTCYYLSFHTVEEAALAMALLTGSEARAFVDAASFPDAKRRFTKQLLARLDLAAIAGATGRDPLARAARDAAGRVDVHDLNPRLLDETISRYLTAA